MLSTRRRQILLVLAAGVLFAGDPSPSRAEAAVPTGGTTVASGLHVSTGTLVDPAGRTWVADHNAGFCRLQAWTNTAPGRIEHPTVAGGAGARTCLGGLLPDAAPGPDAAGQPTLVDPSPEFPDSGDEMALIPDGAAASSDVVRARWNPGSQLFEYLDTVAMVGDRGRPTATTLGPDYAVYVVFQRATTIQRISDPAGKTPTAEIVGRTADGRGAAAVAAGRDAADRLVVWVAETTGVRRLAPDATTHPLTTDAEHVLPAAGGAAPPSVSSLAYDAPRKALWAVTADAAAPGDEGIDRLLRVDVPTGTVTERAAGFTAAGGVAVRPDGDIDVVDDIALTDPAQPLGLGRLVRVGRPVAHVSRGPLVDGAPAADGATSRDRSPSFEIGGDGSQECLLRGAGFSDGWHDCPAGGTLQIDRDLDDGSYTLSVRALAGGVTGLPEAKAFRVDTSTPTPQILRPTAGSTAGAAPWFVFDAEADATFACRFDAEATFSACTPGRTRTFNTAGEHTLQITATDVAGNTSSPSSPTTFTVDPVVPDAVPGSDGSPARHHGRSLAAEGLHIATGAIVDPDGRTWVADHNGGFCRLTPSDEDGPGRIDHPALPGQTGPHTCLGGLLPGAGPGPDAAGQPTLVDPTPARNGNGDEVVLIPDGAASSSGVARARWNPTSGLFEPMAGIQTLGDGRGTRPVATSADADGNVYVVFQRSGTVQRISDAAGDNPQVQVVGRTPGGVRAGAIAVGLDALGHTTVYLDDAGLHSLQPNAVSRPVATPVTALPPTAAVGALAYDRAAGRLLIGTANGVVPADAGTDRVDSLTIADGTLQEGVATGLSMVGGLAVRPDGVVLAVDDPALLTPAQALGQGRLHHVGHPAAHVVRGPLDAAGNPSMFPDATSSTLPAFDVAVDAGEGSAACRLRGVNDPLDTGWTACGPAGRFQPASPLAQGTYVLTVRAADGAVTGLVERHRFSVDTDTPGTPVINSPAERAIVGAEPFLGVTAEPGAQLSCRWEQTGPWVVCAAGRMPAFTANGDHVLQVRATDRAGNVSPASGPRHFTVRANVTQVTITGGPTGVTADRDATFTFTADAPDVTFGCRLAGTSEAFAVCTSPRRYTGLADGDYTFEVRAKDAAGNVTALTRRSFTVDTRPPAGPAAQSGAAAPGPPQTVTVTDGRTGGLLTLLIANLDPTINLAQLRQTGIAVRIIPARGTQLIRVRIFRLVGGQRRGGRAAIAAAPRRGRLALTMFKRAPRGRGTIRLTRSDLRGLGTGRYVLELAAASSRTKVGRPVSRQFRVMR
ncbi:MAG: repeat domain protein [Solirubrobacterales bacterium]|nr:repeat domain protein [Solirubrobacterales bacterium]